MSNYPGTPGDFAKATYILALWAYWNAQADECEGRAAGDDPRMARDGARMWRAAAAAARAVLLDLPGGPELWNLRTRFTYDA